MSLKECSELRQGFCYGETGSLFITADLLMTQFTASERKIIQLDEGNWISVLELIYIMTI